MLNEWSVDVGEQIANALAILIGIAVPDRAYIAFAVQARHETAGGLEMAAQNNPLNLRPIPGGWPGQTGISQTASGEFAIFGSIQAGCWACARNYDNPSYAGVIRAFQDGDPVAIATAIEQSPWDADHYGFALHNEVEAELGGDTMTDDELRAAIKRIYAGPDSLEEMVKADVRVMVEQDPETRNAIAAIAPAPSTVPAHEHTVTGTAK